jgi:pimeloyl-ACP methyl ester carboxylesterase
LHGLFGISDNWLNIGKQLADLHQCYILDMRNHGRSPHSTDLNYDDMVEDIYEFLTDFGLRTVSLIGHSMGGITAMKFAFEYSHRVEKLVVVDIAPKSYPALHGEIIDGLRSIPVERLKSRNEADEILEEYVPSSRIRQFLLKNLFRKDDQNYAWRINLDAIQKHATEIGRGITGQFTFEKPTLFIRGEKSSYIQDSDESRIKNMFPQAIIKTIAGSSHWVHAEQPEEFLKMLRAFL